MTGHDMRLTRRHTLFALTGVAAALTAVAPEHEALAQTAGANATGPVQELNQALLASMRAGNTPFNQRYAQLAPVIERVFDLDDILARSVGFSWNSMPPAEKATLAAAFRRYTVSSYLANFDSYNGQNFQVVGTRPAGGGQTVAQTRLLRPSGDPVELDYVMAQTARGWRAVDVLTNGTISRVAVQRSDFRRLLSSGGVPALTASLERKVASLSGGMAA